MVTGGTSPSDGDLKQLRQRYERLCDLMTRTAESDPAAADHVLWEIRLVSERIAELEATGGPTGGKPAADARPPAAAAPQEPLDSPRPDSPDVAPPAGSPHRLQPRILSFRATPVPLKTAGAAASQPATGPSWRVDEPPQEPPPEIPARPWPLAPAPHPEGAPDESAEPEPIPEAEPKEEDQPAEPADAEAPAEPADAELPAASGAAAAKAPPVGGNATVFSSAIRQWLERHNEPGANKAPAPPVRPARPATRAAPPGPAQQAESARLSAAIEQQATQIERILRLCQEQQAALERLERLAADRLQPPSPAPSAADPDLSDLRLAVEEQRQRVTALAKTIHNLAQWLASQRPVDG